MKLYFLILLLISSFSIQANAINDKEADCIIGKDFGITISPSFKEKYKYVFGRGQSANCVFYVTYENGKSSHIVKFLSDNKANELLSLYQNAISFPLFDKHSYTFKDGVNWSIENELYQEFRINISSPDYQAKKRGYIKLLEFEKYLSLLFKDS